MYRAFAADTVIEIMHRDDIPFHLGEDMITLTSTCEFVPVKTHVKWMHEDNTCERPLYLLQSLPGANGRKLEATPFIEGSRAELEKTLRAAGLVYRDEEYSEWVAFAELHPSSDNCLEYLQEHPQEIPLYDFLFASADEAARSGGREVQIAGLSMTVQEAMDYRRSRDLFLDVARGGGMIEADSMPSVIFTGHRTSATNRVPPRQLQPHIMLEHQTLLPPQGRRERSQRRFLDGVARQRQRENAEAEEEQL